jgi:ribosome-associated heat shock protein Hsp15
MSDTLKGSVRLDKYLWAARFYKTRQLAIEAVNAGRVAVNGDRAKPAKAIKPGDLLLVRKPPYEFALVVKATSEKRGAAPIARALYEELPESIVAREKLHAELRDQPPPLFKGRPTKKDRRTLEQWARAASIDDDD